MLSTPRKFPALLADIGGTNARFALLMEAGGQPQYLQTLACADYEDVVAAIEAYLSALSSSSSSFLSTPRPWEAVIAIANPVTGDQIKMTNHNWSFSIEQTRQRLNLVSLRVVNDFTALALSLPQLRPNEQIKIGGGEAKLRATIGLIGPGTGLGVSGLVPSGETGWIPLAGEGGHVGFSPADEEEDRILSQVRQKYPIVSAERLISGPGLINLYRAVTELAGQVPAELTPAQISKQAVEATDPLCQHTLELFCSMLGSVAGNLALTLGAEGGVYIGGGIAPGIIDFMEKSRFRERFEAKGRMSAYLKNVPTFVIVASNPALLGTAALLQHE